MPYDPHYRDDEPSRAEVNRLEGPVVIEFGAAWCGFCRALAPEMRELLGRHPDVQHVKIADGPGKPLGRSFRVKLWPTLVFMRDGEVVRTVARPGRDEAEAGLQAIVSNGQPKRHDDFDEEAR